MVWLVRQECSREGVCGNNAVQFQSCDCNSNCTALWENGYIDIVSCHLIPAWSDNGIVTWGKSPHFFLNVNFSSNNRYMYPIFYNNQCLMNDKHTGKTRIMNLKIWNLKLKINNYIALYNFFPLEGAKVLIKWGKSSNVKIICNWFLKLQ